MPSMAPTMRKAAEPTKEHCLREVERAMLYIADAQRKAERTAAQLEAEGAEARYVNALRTAAAALRAEHGRLLASTHFTVPDEPLRGGGEDLKREEGASQQRMAL